MTHGQRRAYSAGCRCVGCRAANAAYSAAHRVPIGTIDAAPVRVHLSQLQRLGVGYRTIARQTGVSASVVSSVLSGAAAQLRPSTAARLLLARPSVARGAFVPATRTWRHVDSLRREGYTRREMAYHLGAHSQQLQLGARLVRASTALRVAQLYERITT